MLRSFVVCHLYDKVRLFAQKPVHVSVHVIFESQEIAIALCICFVYLQYSLTCQPNSIQFRVLIVLALHRYFYHIEMSNNPWESWKRHTV